MDRLAQGLQKLQEEDLLQVVRMVTEHKTQEMYVKNDLEGMFSNILELIRRRRVCYGLVYIRRSLVANFVGFHKTES
jgi:hypothetical protein